jgi:Zn-dependent peptidase ImmA (M78 family)/O-acetyl-ADP-ribose deacetylase (regulator of RNase III)
MKTPPKKLSISTNMIEKDLNTLFRSAESSARNFEQDDPEPKINLEGALEVFDRMRAGRDAPVTEPEWTHPSVLALGDADPTSAIILRARRLVLDAMERGWSGPPYNPFELAEMHGIRLLPTDAVLDARTQSDRESRFTIEYNPQRPIARMRYSVAHEIGHTLFPDCAAATRNRTTHQEMKDNDWQLESLCNIAAAEILMPFGTLQEVVPQRPSMGLILDLRRKYLVSCEAVVNRLLKLCAYPCLAFFARLDTARARYFVEYCLNSPNLRERSLVHRGYQLPRSSKASACVAIGSREQEDARWISGTKPWFVEYLGISPNAGDIYTRVLAVACPPLPEAFTAAEQLRFLKGDASEPFGAEPKLLLQVVNDQAQIWGGGFAKQIRKKWPQAQAHFRQWSCARGNLKLGNIHSVNVRPDLTLVSLVAQHGFGRATSGPRLRYAALFSALEQTAVLAKTQSASVHMPRIGTGEAGGSWTIVEGIIRETLISMGIQANVYDLSSPPPGIALQSALDFPRDVVDEVL